MRTARTLMSNVEAVEATKQLRNTRRSGHRIENAPLNSAEKLSCKKFCSKLIAVECAIIVHCDRFAFEIA